MSKHTTAQYLVNACKQYRCFHEADFSKQFYRLRNVVAAVLTKASEATTDNEVSEVLCGLSLHTSNTESYFPEITYTSAAFDKNSNVLRCNFPEHATANSERGTETWKCSTDLCIMPSKDLLTQVLSNSIVQSDPTDALCFVEHIDDCTKPYTHAKDLQGHNKDCHVYPNACGSKLLYLRHLAPHFPNIRTIVSMLYTVKKTTTTIKTIDKAFKAENITALEHVTEHREIISIIFLAVH